MTKPPVALRLLAVTAAVPKVYALDPNPRRLTLVGRVVAVLIAAACLLLLILAALVVPDRSGSGTHQSLGLQPCGWMTTFAIPCFSCGMTTSFAWFVRGNLLASFYVQPMGFVLAVLTAMTFWACVYVAVTARPAYVLLSFIPLRYSLWPAVGFTLLAWAWKMLIHLRGVDGW